MPHTHTDTRTHGQNREKKLTRKRLNGSANHWLTVTEMIINSTHYTTTTTTTRQRQTHEKDTFSLKKNRQFCRIDCKCTLGFALIQGKIVYHIAFQPIRVASVGSKKMAN